MTYQKCKRCGKELDEHSDLNIESQFNGISVDYECECGSKCKVVYNFEHTEPSNVFWDDYQIIKKTAKKSTRSSTSKKKATRRKKTMFWKW